MWVKISIMEQKHGEEAKLLAQVNGSEADARNLHEKLSGFSVQGDEGVEVFVQAEKRIPASPTYVPIDFGSNPELD